jgi:hypothetical protein
MRNYSTYIQSRPGKCLSIIMLRVRNAIFNIVNFCSSEGISQESCCNADKPEIQAIENTDRKLAVVETD